MHDIEVRKSRIHGLGVFAVGEIGAEELIREYHLVREITQEKPLDPSCGEALEHCTYPGDRVFLVGEPDRHFNHSCDPNAFKGFEGASIRLFSRSRIAAGEEITHDYLINTHGGSKWHCHCGAERCRGVMPASFFDLPLAIQLEYLPYLASWFVDRHRASVDELRHAQPSHADTP